MTSVGTPRPGAARRRWWHLHLRRLLRAPLVHAPAQVEVDADGCVEVLVDGVVCSVCAVRTESALAGLEGVQDVQVDLASGRAHLRLAPGATVDASEMQRALEGVVMGIGLRRWIERAARRLRPGKDTHA